MAGAENSPSKRMVSAMRKSPPYHPYVRAGGKLAIKSPLKQQSENVSFKHISDKNFFSFSGGSASLFPSNNSNSYQQPSVRSAMSELSNILKNKPGAGAHQKLNTDEALEMVGIIGGQRKPVGFIPVESSCTISGGSGLGKVSLLPDITALKNNINNSMNASQTEDGGFERSTSFTYVPTGTIPMRSNVEGEPPQQLGGIQWPIYNKQRIVHAKTFHPPAPSELPLPLNLSSQDTTHFDDGVDNAESDCFLIFEEAPSPSAKENEQSYISCRSHDDSLVEGTVSRNSTRIPLSDISACSSIISCDILSANTLDDSGLSAMDDKCTFGLGMNNSNISQDILCHEEIDFDLEQQEQEPEEKPRKFFKNWVPGAGAPTNSAKEEELPPDVFSLSDNDTRSVISSRCDSPDVIPPTVQRPSSGIQKIESFNCSFNSSFNDHLADLGIDSCSAQGPEKGVLTEQMNPFFDFPEYSFDILNHWVTFEKKVRPRWRFMDKQKDISQKMRSILIDWLVEVGVEYELQEATVFLAVSFIDRFLSKMAVSRGKLQLIGTAALFVASKYEEISPPVIKDFVYITDETYSKEQLLRMEKIMLNVLNFDLMAPTSYDFSKAYCSLLQLSGRATSLAMYLTELSLTDGTRFMNFLPSLIAIGAVGLARYTVDNVFWDERLASLTKHRRHDVERTAQHLYHCFYDAPISQQTAIYEKYKSVKYCAIALSMLPSKLPWRMSK